MITLKSAAEYRRLADETVHSHDAELGQQAEDFINTILKPAVEAAVCSEHPKTGLAIDYPKTVKVNQLDKFIATVAAYLRPLGYEVKQTHDGGGMYAMIRISWA